jgi:3,4-dihydroxy 2-butanone 4-phosphate synthase/GTP cyclohydrolase II
LRCDSLVHRVAEARINSRYGGEFRIIVYHSDVDDGEHVVLQKGEIEPGEPVLVRAHAEFLPGDVFRMAERNTASLLHEAMRVIATAGKGVVLYLRREGRGAEILESAGTIGRSQRQAMHTPSTDPATRQHEFRDYGLGAQILRDIGARKIRLLTNSPRNLVSLPGYGLEVVECVPLQLETDRKPTPKATASRPRQSHTS